MVIWAVKCYKDIQQCLYLMIWQLFRFLSRNLSSFLVVFLENLRHQKNILKLTDLYSNLSSFEEESSFSMFVKIWRRQIDPPAPLGSTGPGTKWHINVVER